MNLKMPDFTNGILSKVIKFFMVIGVLVLISIIIGILYFFFNKLPIWGGLIIAIPVGVIVGLGTFKLLKAWEEQRILNQAQEKIKKQENGKFYIGGVPIENPKFYVEGKQISVTGEKVKEAKPNKPEAETKPKSKVKKSVKSKRRPAKDGKG